MTAILDAPFVNNTVPTQRLSEDWCLHIPKNAMTLNGFRSWVISDEFPEKLRATFVEEEIYLDMSKEEMTTHAAVKAAICLVLMQIVEEQASGQFLLDGVLLSNESAGVSNNPDGLFLSFDGLAHGKFRLIRGASDDSKVVEIEGTPDWIMEIISAGSVRKDSVQLRKAYFLAGIPEYWLIDACGAEIRFEILRAAENGYERVAIEDGWQFSTVFKRSFRLERTQNAFGWKYKLHVKPV